MSEVATILRPSDIDRMIDAVTERVAGKLDDLKGSIQEQALTSKQAAAFMQINITTLFRLMKSDAEFRKLVRHVGTELRFFPSELNAYIKSRK